MNLCSEHYCRGQAANMQYCKPGCRYNEAKICYAHWKFGDQAWQSKCANFCQHYAGHNQNYARYPKNGRGGGNKSKSRLLNVATPQATNLMKIKCIRRNEEYLIDSGASVSIIPKQNGDEKDPLQLLKAANATAIETYGTTMRSIALNKKLCIDHEFIKADVATPILGADFLSKNKLWLNMNKLIMVHEETGEKIKGNEANSYIHNVVQLHDERTKAILQKVPDAIFKPGEVMPEPHKNAPYLEIKTNGRPLPQYRPRRLAPQALRLTKEHFNDLLRRKRVSESTAPCSSPLHIIPKGDTYRWVGDYRSINAISEKCNYALPYIHDATAQMAGMKVFSKVDLKAAFEHLPIHPRDIDKTTVCTPFGSFKFHFGNYGLKNASQTFQMFIDRALRGLTRIENGVEHKVTHFAFVDDILVASADMESHEKDLIAMLQRLAEYKLKINLKKCEFFKQELEFLGHIFCSKGIKPTKERVEAIINYKRPKTLGGLKRFLGIVNFYHKFVENAAGIMKPLNQELRGYNKKMRHKNVDWSNNHKLAESYEKTKTALAEKTLLVYPQENAKIGLFCDASDDSISGVMMQQDGEGHFEPLGFFSKSLNSREVLASTFQKEVTAIYKSLRYFQDTLQGLQFTIYTDNKAIVKAVVQISKTHTNQVSRMLSYISTFGAPVEHIAGNKNMIADLLSRPKLQASSIYIDDVIKKEEFMAEQAKCPEVQQLKGKNNNLSIAVEDIKGLACDTKHGLYRPVVPINMRRRIFNQIHDLAHPGSKRTLDLIRVRFVWPNMCKQIKKWARECRKCQMTKITKHNRPQMDPITPPSIKFEEINIDLVGPLPRAGKYRYLLTAIDRYSLFPEAIPIENAAAKTVTDALVLHIFGRYGLCKKLTTDRGAIFLSQEFRETMRIFGIKHQFTTSYNPQSNGVVEKFHRFLKASLRATLCDGDPTNWDIKLGMVLLSIRNSYSERLKTCPSQVVYGQATRLPGDLMEAPDGKIMEANEYAQNLRQELLRIRPGAPTFKAKLGYIDPELNNCKYVFIRNMHKQNKMVPNYLGPYKVLERHDKYFTVQLDKKQDTIAMHRLKPAYCSPCERINAKIAEEQEDTLQMARSTRQKHQKGPSNLPKPDNGNSLEQQTKNTVGAGETQHQNTPLSLMGENRRSLQDKQMPNQDVRFMPNVCNRPQTRKSISWTPNREMLRNSFREPKESSILKRLRSFNEKGLKEGEIHTRLRSSQKK